MDFLEVSGGSLAMAWVLLGSIIIPSLDTMNPSNLPYSTANMDFLGFKEMLYLRHRSRMARK
jgi:hypothetical protein